MVTKLTMTSKICIALYCLIGHNIPMRTSQNALEMKRTMDKKAKNALWERNVHYDVYNKIVLHCIVCCGIIT